MIIKPYSHFQKCICALVFIVLTNFELRVSHQIELLKVWLFINQLHKYFHNRQKNSLLLCLPSVKECVCKQVNHFASAIVDSGRWRLNNNVNITISKHKLSRFYMIYCILQVLYLKYAGLGSVCSKVSLTIKLNEKCALEVKTYFGQ